MHSRDQHVDPQDDWGLRLQEACQVRCCLSVYVCKVVPHALEVVALATDGTCL